jgi:hypothetical protein
MSYIWLWLLRLRGDRKKRNKSIKKPLKLKTHKKVNGHCQLKPKT